MLRDVVGDFLDSVTEREFDGPFLALLGVHGFTDIHFLHGAFEFGKDFIAKGEAGLAGATVGAGSDVVCQYAFQSKAGNIGLPEWRSVRPQLDEARLDGLAHPAFDTSLPRVGVLVTTGRLTGGAAVQAQSYRESELKRGRPDIVVWDRERLIEMISSSPEVGISGETQSSLLRLLTSIDSGTISFKELEKFSRSWLPTSELREQGPGTSTFGRMAIEAAVVVNKLRLNGRLDLAAYVALMLLRAAWVGHYLGTGGTPGRPPSVSSAIRLFVGCASELLKQIEPIAHDPRALLSAAIPSPVAHITYPVTCARIAEILSLLALLVDSGRNSEGVSAGDGDALQTRETVLRFIRSQPGCVHLVGDAYAASLIAPTLLAIKFEPATAVDFIKRAAIWLIDRYDEEKAGIGLAENGAEPEDEIARLLGGPYENGLDRRSSSYIATVIADLSSLLPDDKKVYLDYTNDLQAVRIFPQLRVANEAVAHWRNDVEEVSILSNINYADSPSSERPFAKHHDDVVPDIPAWDALALTSVVRSRHYVSNWRAIVQQ